MRTASLRHALQEVMLMLNPKEDNTMSKTKVSDQEVKKKQPIVCSASSTDVYNSRCYEAKLRSVEV